MDEYSTEASSCILDRTPSNSESSQPDQENRDDSDSSSDSSSNQSLDYHSHSASVSESSESEYGFEETDQGGIRMIHFNIPPNSNELLMDVIRSDQQNIPNVVKEFMHEYFKNSEIATAELLLMIFYACEAKHDVGWGVYERDVNDVVTELVNEAEEDDDVACQNSKWLRLENFQQKFISFWGNLVDESHYGPLYDNVLYEKCTEYIIALSCSPPLVHRRVATAIGLALLKCFINVIKMIQWKITYKQPYLDPSAKPLTMLPSNEERMSIMQNMVEKLYAGVFVHRSQDVDSDIRSLCMEYLGVWVLLYPSKFLEYPILKQLGYALGDQSSDVKTTALHALRQIYLDDELVPCLRQFTERFSGKLIELASEETDVSVVVGCVKLLQILLWNELLPRRNIKPVLNLLLNDNAETRRAIGVLVHNIFIARKYRSTQAGSTGASADSFKVHLRRILRRLRDCKNLVEIAYITDALWVRTEALTDWACIISLLLDEDDETNLGDLDITNLIRLLRVSARKAVGRITLPDIAEIEEKHFSEREKKVHKKNRLEVTLAIMEGFPRLSRKFMADKYKMTALVYLIRDLDLGLYTHRWIEEDEDGDCEYPVLDNLTRLYGPQMARPVLIDNLFENFEYFVECNANVDNEVMGNLLYNMYMHVAWSLSAIQEEETLSMESVNSLLLKRSALFRNLDYFVNNERRGPREGQTGRELAVKVCLVLIEMWRLFDMSKFSSTPLEMLGFSPDIHTIQKFWAFCRQLFDIVSGEPESIDPDYYEAEKTSEDVAMIAAAKLVVNGVVPMNYLGSEMISYYGIPGTHLEEAVTGLIDHLKKNSIQDVPDIFIEAMKRVFIRNTPGMTYKESRRKSAAACKKLASRLSTTFTYADRNKHKSLVFKIVKDGIFFVFQHPNHLPFLEALQYFVYELPASDCLYFLEDVEGKTKNVNTYGDLDKWHPYNEFVDQLRGKCGKFGRVNDESPGRKEPFANPFMCRPLRSRQQESYVLGTNRILGFKRRGSAFDKLFERKFGRKPEVK